MEMVGHVREREGVGPVVVDGNSWSQVPNLMMPATRQYSTHTSHTREHELHFRQFSYLTLKHPHKLKVCIRATTPQRATTPSQLSVAGSQIDSMIPLSYHTNTLYSMDFCK